jgi:phospholipase B1
MLQNLAVLVTSALAVKSITECPTFPSRASAPTSVRDVRVDDIKIVAAMGDSITAGFAALGLSNPNQQVGLRSLVENRGVSFSIGGDPASTTVGNFIARYVPGVKGRSVGNHGPNICTPSFCLGRYTPEIDRFNAARTGAVSSNFGNQLSYLDCCISNIFLVD